MRKLLLPLPAILAIALIALGAAAGPDPEEAAPAETPAAEQAVVEQPGGVPAAEAGSAAATPPAPILSPLMQEITARLDRMRDEVRALEAHFATTRDPQESLRLQLAIEQAKREAELDVLRLQAEHARREGRLAVVAEIEAAIELMTAPPAAATPRPERAVER